MFVPLTPLDFKWRPARLYGARCAVVDGETRYTYAEFAERTSRLANALLDAGLQGGERVAYLAYNSYPLLEGYYGVLEAGGILLPLNIRLSRDEIAYILTDSGTRFLLIDPDFAPMLDGILAHLEQPPGVVWLRSSAERPEPLYDDLLAAASPLPGITSPGDENDVAELFYTSGTTGRPKGVMLTHRNLYLHAVAGLASLPTNQTDVLLHTIPLFHVNGWGTPHSLTAVGAKHVMLRKFDPGEALRLIEREGVTRFFAVPTMLAMMLEHPHVHSRDLSTLQVVNLGGAPVAPSLVSRAQAILGCKVFSGYGLSETSPVISLALDSGGADADEEAQLWQRASAGIPVIGVDLRIVDEPGNSLPWDGSSVGEVVVRGNVVMKGYWQDDEATRQVIRDGWFHTGDMATVSPDGYFLIVDRKKDIIISGGENISSVEIEKVLASHPGVIECAVIGVPDVHWGEVPKAIVSLREGRAATEDDLIEFCRTRLAAFKVPRSVEFLPVLPKGGTGKILKRRLREPFWEGREKQV